MSEIQELLKRKVGDLDVEPISFIKHQIGYSPRVISLAHLIWLSPSIHLFEGRVS
ncbi:hypothetical protein EKH55_3486 [Sinorhizobium alkalisoli]|nr:hypothetical protein EKH55_3486 [Sinorhizobium alkalisoli]